MNKLFSIALFPLALLLFGTDSENATSTKSTADEATVYFYRGKQFTTGLNNFVLQANGKEICRLSVKRYVVYKGQPGRVSFSAREGGLTIKNKESLEIELESGKEYYVQCDVKTGVVSKRMEMTEVMPSTGKKKLEELEPDNCMTK